MATNRLTLGADGNGTGTFVSLQHNISFLFEKNPDHKPTDENSPSHKVHLKTAHGSVECGAAWQKTVRDGANKGSRFYSFTIDDPSFDAPLNLTAFVLTKPANKDDFWEFEVVWRRRRDVAA